MTTRRVKRLDELAQSVPPSRDLWPAIAAAIEADKAAATAPVSAARRSRWLPAAGLAAAVALVTIGVLIGQNMGTKTQDPLVATTTTQTGNPEVVRTAVQREAEYQNQRKALLVEVQAKLQTMPAADRAKVEASLTTLQRSIDEIKAALGADPANALLQELLVSSCQEEMRALTAVRDSGSLEI
jgi:hypothetical protein